MLPKKINVEQTSVFRVHFKHELDPELPIMVLANKIDWTKLEAEFGKLFEPRQGKPAKPIRLITGLLMLQHIYGLSDREVVGSWQQNPYWQYFCGYGYLQWKAPINPSTLTRWRQKLGEEGMTKILSETVDCAIRNGVVKKKDLKKVIADTTVMEKNITHPTDGGLLNRARQKLVQVAKQTGIKLRQTYAHVGETLRAQVARYVHLGHFSKARATVKKLKTYLGRVVRDFVRKASQEVKEQLPLKTLLSQANRLLIQEVKSKKKLYSLHEPNTYCVAKGKVAKRFEFGTKVALVVTHKQGLALSAEAIEEPTHDAHTLAGSLDNAVKISGEKIEQVFVDRGYRGHKVKSANVFITGQHRGATKSIKRDLKRRSAIEPHIGHMKSDGKLARNYLKGILGDKLNAILCAVGHNLRLIIARIQRGLLGGALAVKSKQSRKVVAHC